MITIVAIVGKNGVIGFEGRVPWRISEDMRRFRALTIGNTVVMGRKTFDSIGGPLEDRENIVVSRNSDYHAKGCRTCNSIETALVGENIFVIGGGEIYEQTIALADRMFLTLVDDAPKGDAFFPQYNDFKEVKREAGSGEQGLTYCFIELCRI